MARAGLRSAASPRSPSRPKEPSTASFTWIVGLLALALCGRLDALAAQSAPVVGESRPSLGLKVTLERAGDDFRSTAVVINSGPLAAVGTQVRFCLPAGWRWREGSLPWKRSEEDPPNCRRFLLGAVPGRKERRFTLEFVAWPPLGWEGGSLFPHLLDVTVYAASHPGAPVEKLLSRLYELHPADESRFVEPPEAAQSASLTLEAEAERGRAGVRWRVANEGEWGSISAGLEVGGDWKGRNPDLAGGGSSLAWTAGEGAGRIGSSARTVDFAWRWGPAKETNLGGLEPTLPVTAAWRVGGQASGRSPFGDGPALARLDVGRAVGDVWSCRLTEAVLRGEGSGGELELRIAEALNTLFAAKGIQVRRASLAQLETGSWTSIGGTPWTIRGALARGVPRTLTPSCGLSPKEGWRLRLQAENAGPGPLEGVSWTAAWPLDRRRDRPFTQEFSVAISAAVAPELRVDVEPALRLATRDAPGLAMRTQALVGRSHRLRFELGPKSLEVSSELPRSGEGSGRIALGWDVRRGSVRPRLAYEAEDAAEGRAHELRGGLTLLGSVPAPWSGGSRRVEWSAGLSRDVVGGAGKPRLEELLALRLGRRPSTLRAEWSRSGGKRRVSVSAEHEAKRPEAMITRARLLIEQRVEAHGAGSADAPATGIEAAEAAVRSLRWEGAVEGRWAAGSWGGALARASGVAARAYATWELGMWHLRGEWIESLHDLEASAFARWAEVGVKRAIAESVHLVLRSGHLWSAGSGSGEKGLWGAPVPEPGAGESASGAASGRGSVEWRPSVAMEWRPALLGSEALVAFEVEFPGGRGPGSPRIELSLGAPVEW